jgi:hypothetical protein
LDFCQGASFFRAAIVSAIVKGVVYDDPTDRNLVAAILVFEVIEGLL